MPVDVKTLRSLDTETTGVESHEAKILGWSDFVNGEARWDATQPPVIEESDFIIAHNGKYDANILWHNYGIAFQLGYDTMLAEYILHIDKEKKLESILKRRFKIEKKDLFQLWCDVNPQAFLNEKTGERKKNVPTNLPDRWWETVHKTLKSGKVKLVHNGVPMSTLSDYAMADVESLQTLREAQLEEFNERPTLKRWFDEVEMPFCNLLIESERRGVYLDREYNETLRQEVRKKRDALEVTLRKWAGKPGLNLNSSLQMQEILYGKFNWPKKKVWRNDSGTGYKCSKEVYAAMAPTHLFARRMLEFNELDDLLIKFIEPLPAKADANGRIHCNFNQAGTRTRRMSSSNPNLQQIPSKTELGQRVRAAFKASPGTVFLIADYDQIEIRLAAHFSDDLKLIESIMNADYDVHTCTAADMYNIHPRDVTKAQRGVGKLINFSIFYGKSAFGFAKDWVCSEKEAQDQINLWFSKRPRCKEWIQEQKAYARKTGGWVKTLAGLPLYIGDVHSRDQWELDKVLRRAVNYPIQGSSQDVIKKACVKNYQEFHTVPLLFVHDEIVVELNQDTAEADAPRIIANMESVYDLKVPLKVSWELANHWKK